MVDKIDFAKEEEKLNSKSDYSDFSDDELSPKFIKMPNVNEETGFIRVSDFRKTSNIQRKDKSGNPFSVALSGVDFAVELQTDKGVMTINNWEVFGKLKTGFIKLAEERKVKFYDIVRSGEVLVNIVHVYDGMDKKNPDALKAKKEKKLYEVKFKVGEDTFIVE